MLYRFYSWCYAYLFLLFRHKHLYYVSDRHLFSAKNLVLIAEWDPNTFRIGRPGTRVALSPTGEHLLFTTDREWRKVKGVVFLPSAAIGSFLYTCGKQSAEVQTFIKTCHEVYSFPNIEVDTGMWESYRGRSTPSPVTHVWAALELSFAPEIPKWALQQSI